MSVNVVKYATTSKLDLKSRKCKKIDLFSILESFENIKWDLWEVKKNIPTKIMPHCIFIQIYAKFVSTTIWSTGAKGYDFSDEAIWMQDGRDEKTHDFSAHIALTMC